MFNASIWPRIAAFCVFAAASPALAQTEAPAADSNDGDIVVTARKIEENSQTVPISLSAVSAAALEEHTVRTIDDIASLSPNLFIQRVGIEPQSLVISLRGQYQNDIPLTADPSIGVYVDGLYHPRTIGLAGALVDLERVEVLRGPQGTLFGRNTTGGAMNIVTADPTQKLEGSVSLTLGDYNLREGVGVLNLPITENLAGRFVVQRGQRDGYANDALGNDLNKDDSTYARAKFLYTPTDKLKVELFGSYSKNEAGGGIIHLAGRPVLIFSKPLHKQVSHSRRQALPLPLIIWTASERGTSPTTKALRLPNPISTAPISASTSPMI
jgi:iron complex outermembrane receptor protein